MTEQADLASRVLAAIEETERIARAAEGHSLFDGTGILIGRVGAVVAPSNVATHIAHSDPAAVLRRCLADRRVWRRHEPNVIDGRETPVCISCAYCSSGRVDAVPWPCPDVLDLAEGYGITPREDQ